MQLNAGNVKSETDVTGFTPPAPGRYDVLIKNVDDSYQRAENAVIVEFQVLAGTTPGQENLLHTERMFLKDGLPSDVHVRFALASGIMQPGTAGDVDLKSAIGRRMVIGIDKRKGKDGKEYTNIAEYGMAMWGLANPAVADVPKAQVQPAAAAPPTQPAAVAQQPAPVAAAQPQAAPPAAAPAAASPAAAPDPYANI